MNKNMISENTPVVVGVGQVVEHIQPASQEISSALDLAAVAAQRALADAQATQDIAPHINALAAIRLFEDSTRKIAIVNNPLGRSNNVPGSIAKRLNITPEISIYAAVGGNTPQKLVNEMSERIYSGELNCALITGAEAIANIKHAVKNQLDVDWNESVDDDFEDRWQKNNADNMVSDYEMSHGLFFPVQAYPLFENAHRRKLQHNLEQHRVYMGKLFAEFSKVAAANPFAQFPTARSAEFLSQTSAQNYLLSEPYTKWLVAQDAVNQGAATLVMSVGLARQLGVPESRWVYLHKYVDLDDVNVVDRPDLTVSEAQNIAIRQCLAGAKLTVNDIDVMDIYSCFPIAVSSACAGLQIDPFSRPLTLTGGLPFFGGPGNNYSMHAIAELIARLRAEPNSNGLIIANGGYLSKHSVGIYSTRAVSNWQPTSSQPARDELANHPVAPVIREANGKASIETYVLSYRKGVPDVGYVFARTRESNHRFIARVAEQDLTTLGHMRDEEPLDRQITVQHDNGINTFQFA